MSSASHHHAIFLLDRFLEMLHRLTVKKSGTGILIEFATSLDFVQRQLLWLILLVLQCLWQSSFNRRDRFLRDFTDGNIKLWIAWPMCLWCFQKFRRFTLQITIRGTINCFRLDRILRANVCGYLLDQQSVRLLGLGTYLLHLALDFKQSLLVADGDLASRDHLNLISLSTKAD